MPVLEVDVLYAGLDRDDPHSEVCSRILNMVRERRLKNVRICSLALHELELNLKAGNILVHGRKADLDDIVGFFEDLGRLLTLYRLDVLALTCEEIIEAAKLRRDYGLSFYDSHHAAAALLFDSEIISMDGAYDAVAKLKRTDPYSAAREQ